MNKVVNLNTDEYDIYIGRPSIYGNPYPASNRIKSISLFKNYFYNRIKSDKHFLDKVNSLQGKTLGCFCKPLPCHGDIIIEFLEKKDE